MVYGTLRRRARLDSYLDARIRGGMVRLDADLLDLLRLGASQLLFMESVPNDETRAYIPRVLAYSWLYAAELGLPSPSLDELAAGSWPRFRPDAPKRELLARLH